MIELIIGVGLLGVVASFVSWWKEARPANTLRAAGETGGVKFRAALFGLWTLALPLYFLWEWHYGNLDLTKLSSFQYRNKVTSDAWVAVTLVLGVLFGIRKF